MTAHQTATCVGCTRLARYTSGIVIIEETGEEVAAGLCVEHGASREALPCPNSFGILGCYGYWKPEYGLEEDTR